jgi:diguanylate cyclase (GGDEF)-like protein
MPTFFPSVVSMSTVVMATGLILTAGRFAGARVIRDAGLGTALVAVGMSLQDANRSAQFPKLGALSTVCFSTYVAWAMWVIRARTRRPIDLRVSIAMTAMAMVFGCFFGTRYAAFMEGCSYVTMCFAWALCLPATFFEKRSHLRSSAFLVGACCGVDIFNKGIWAYLCFTESDLVNAGVSFAPTGLVSFWLMMLGNFGTVMFVFRQLNAVSEEHALLDPLTSVYNRRGLDSRLAFLSHKTPQSTVGVIALDIDNFKAVNDRFGHAEGDTVLVECAERLRRALKSHDVVARVGGEEFLVLIDGADSRLTQSISHRLLKVIAERPFEMKSEVALQVTISIGCTTAQMDIKSIEAARLLADRLLYEAKRAGRNRVVS